MRSLRFCLLCVMCEHIGQKNGITARNLVAELRRQFPVECADLSERTLREIIKAKREEGSHICAHPTTGYFIAATPEELDATCEFLHDRAMSSLRQIAAMKKVSVPDLRDQLKLPT